MKIIIKSILISAILTMSNSTYSNDSADSMADNEKNLAMQSEKQLSVLYEKIKKELKTYSRSADDFNSSNKLWSQFVSASCDFDSTHAIGRWVDYRYWSCTKSYNQHRISLLSEYYNCLKGGSNCPNDLHLYYMVNPK